MYNEEGNFTRGKFSGDPKPIEFKGGYYKIVGEMGTDYKAEIKIQIFAEKKKKPLKKNKSTPNEGSSSNSSDSDA